MRSSVNKSKDRQLGTLAAQHTLPRLSLLTKTDGLFLWCRDEVAEAEFVKKSA